MAGLKGKLIISTCSTKKYNEHREIFRERGAELHHLPMIDILQENGDSVSAKVLAKLENFDWIIFTSSYGVNGFFSLTEKYSVKPEILSRFKFATIGKSTSRELLTYGYRADIENSGTSSMDMANELAKLLGNESRNILHPTGNLSGTVISTILGARHNLSRLVVYNTLPVKKTNRDIINRICKGEYDIILFFSPSAFKNFIKHEKVSALHRIRIASIGKTTAMTINKSGFEPLVIARESSIEALVNGLEAYYNNNKVSI